MSLTNRLLTYLLSLLAVVLAGFSLGIYMLVDHYLEREGRERLSAAMSTLVGSLDIELDSVEWEPADRNLSLPHGPLGEDVFWIITDIDGRVIDRARSSSEAASLEQIADAPAEQAPAESIQYFNGWHYLQRRIVAAAAVVNVHRPRTQEEIEKGEYPALVITAGIPQANIERTTRTLAAALAGLSIALWAACFAVGKHICRRALQPVIRMADAAKAMSPDDLRQRLPPVPSGDELQVMHAAFNGLLDRLEVSFQQQRRFTGDASHQLRTPLTIIQGQAEVALRRERSPAEYAEVLQTIRQQAARLHELVENLLFLARPHSDSNAPTLEPIHLAAWLDNVERSWQDSPRAADIHFQNADHTLLAEAHSGMLTEILNNLLDNALKYSAPGDAVTVRVRQSGDSVAIAVEDQGIGMTDDDLKHLFQPFFRSEAARRQRTTGVGLGLSIVNRLAAAMNARVEVETRESQGSTFTLWLRRAANPTPGSSRPVLHERGRE